jgi:hypothetical protein
MLLGIIHEPDPAGMSTRLQSGQSHRQFKKDMMRAAQYERDIRLISNFFSCTRNPFLSCNFQASSDAYLINMETRNTTLRL